ncbi:efflux RND transporter periplasmic adaptor subunit [Carboxylicivirga marina]|uniref:Efflux RND transporter periplasmic adaptor subunit n=1 Tax=Carboxylicivirga marina TaxID=2800988 RepID=A0ABS1HGP7_9BACT|nr:efflux RND transporter periplasmic adaptor subunit [Carboxylicivirga marina]MBK3516766.1 efflux RND transporter periplasmic adaptor subunit [Carboxylicivirga marina]
MKALNLSIVVLLVASLLQACGSDSTKDEKKSVAIAANAEVVKLTSVPKKFHYTGTVSSVNQSTLSTRIMGQISKVLVHEGDAVNKGQLLVSIRSNDIQAKQKQVEANIIQAKASYKHAQDDYKRMQSLKSSNSATQKELDDITVHYEMTKAQLEAAQKAKEEVDEMLSYANIRAPYSGVITQRFVDGGDMANPGMPLLAIEAPGLFEVNAKIPESDIYKLEKGDEVEVLIDACPEPIKGSIARISPSSRFSGSQFDARINLNPSSKQKAVIRSGVFAHVNHFKGEENKLLVASDMVINRGQLKGIWTVSQSNQALLRWVRLGKTYGDKVEVLSGLNEGNQVVTSSKGRLFDGAQLNLN